jgi:hypothetical protein
MATHIQRRRSGLKCTTGEKRFTVVRVDQDPSDTHSGRSFERALELAMPDRGALVEVFSVCAKDVASARLHGVYVTRGTLVRKFRFKGGR